MKLFDSQSPTSVALFASWAVVVLYAFGYWWRLLDSPLVLAPQLDSAELISLARQIANGTLVAEPFYRAMGYPLVLSVFVFLGVESDPLLGLVAVTLGLALHLLNTAMVGSLAQRLWRAETVRPLAVFLFGFNPVVLFFSLDVLDLALGLSGALGAFWCFTHASAQRRWRNLLGGSLLLGLACLVRPHFLFLLPVCLIMLLVASRGLNRGKGICLLGAAVIVMALPLLLQSFWGWRLSGKWELLPWQGAYNLYAANTPGTNGKYFTQSVVIADRPEGTNPARLESEFRYGQATGEHPPFEIDAMSRFWRSQFRAEVLDRPFDWLSLMGRKVYYLFNDFEQYNNKTFAFYRSERLILRWNPLSWGVLLIVATGVLLAGLPERRRGLGLLLLVTSAYAVGVLAFYVSGRFRMPLHAGLVIAASGLPAVVPALSVLRIRIAALGMAIVGVLAFSRFFEADSTDTFVQDRMLLANAAATVGRDALAFEHARVVWETHPARRDAQRLAVLSFFNQQLALLEKGSEEEWSKGLSLVEDLPPSIQDDPPLAFASGVILWRNHRRNETRSLWQKFEGPQNSGEVAQPLEFARDWINGRAAFDSTQTAFWQRLMPLSDD